jgi:hypothetical protein
MGTIGKSSQTKQLTFLDAQYCNNGANDSMSAVTEKDAQSAIPFSWPIEIIKDTQPIT